MSLRGNFRGPLLQLLDNEGDDFLFLIGIWLDMSGRYKNCAPEKSFVSDVFFCFPLLDLDIGAHIVVMHEEGEVILYV